MSESHGESTTDVRVEVEPHEVDRAILPQIRTDLVAHPRVREHLSGANLRIASFQVLDKDPGDDARFDAVVHDVDACRSVYVTGRLGNLDVATVRPSAHRPLPTEQEFTAAVEAVLHDQRLSELVERDRLQAYQPMPPFADVELPDGTVERIVTVGLRGEEADVRHRIVGVRAVDGSIVHEPAGVPQPSSADCEPTPPGGGCEHPAGRDQVRVRVVQGATVLWDFVLVRPKASSGTNGSAVELRYVDYRGTRVLYQAHVPILNVEYGQAGAGIGCGPTYRDWQNQESCFHAVGNDPVGPRFRVCTAPPQTILQSGLDGGNFAGVALWCDGFRPPPRQPIVGWLVPVHQRLASRQRRHDQASVRVRRDRQPVHLPRAHAPRLLALRLRHRDGGQQRGRGVQQPADHR
jgi:hypothetical protein